jgi:hypothetical protein
VRPLALVAAIATAGALALAAQAAAPNYIFVRGSSLERPVLLDDWGENLELFSAIVASPVAGTPARRGLAQRPRLDLAYFWAWSAKPVPTSAAGATQHGTFWPATGSSRALIRLTRDGANFEPRLASSKVLRILARHGIPVRA